MKLDTKYAQIGDGFGEYKNHALKCLNKLIAESEKGDNLTGWMDYAGRISGEYIGIIEDMAQQIRSKSQILIVVGIGGSYLGSKAVIESLSPYFSIFSGLKIIYAGQNLSSGYIREITEIIKTSDVSVNVISKSGSTIETAVAFGIIESHMYAKYGDRAAERIYVTTDAKSGALREKVTKMGYRSLEIPKDIGGRYSVHSAVGLLPLAAAGFNIRNFLNGFKMTADQFTDPSPDNPVVQYTAIRNMHMNNGKSIEAICAYEPKLASLMDWWIQLFGETEGKEGRGLFPVKLNYTTDLHSMGQMMQEGRRIIFETVLYIKNSGAAGLTAPTGLDQDYLNGIEIESINSAAFVGTTEAHLEGGVPNILIYLEELSEKSLGELMYFFMMSAAVGAYMLDLNPFDQPGVEAYKKNVQSILKQRAGKESK